MTFEREDVAPRIRDWLLRHVSPDQIVLSFREIELMDAAIRAGHGLGITNLRMAEADEAAGRLIRCFEPPEELSAQHLLLASPDAYRRAEVKEFIRFFAPRYAAIYK